jgi:single-stranded-DNA-specific exonuclease
MKWQLPSKIDIPPDLLAFTGDPLLAQLLAQRGLADVEQARAFLDPTCYQPAPPEALPDMDKAVARLRQAIARNESICIWGDFDVDGQTAAALLVSTLQDLGAQVRYYIPNRLTESHGIKLPALKRLLAEGVNLILTCDTGVTEHDAVAAANAAGVDIIITDHHDPDDSLPPAQAVINPKCLSIDHSLRELPGVGVAFKLAQALYQAAGRPAAGDSLLDLAALGIVADVAWQSGDTRYLLQQGLDALNQTQRTGLRALIESANIKAGRLTEEHIGFWLAPRLNALGRLGDANLAVELLTTSDLTRARIIALQLEALNDRRKLLVDRVVAQALSQLEDTPSLAEYNALVLASTDWHPGVIGIAANRLADQYGKPAVLISLRPDGLGRGSARSVPGCDIHQALKSQAGLLVSFGGHPGAAGLALNPEKLADFRRGLSDALADYRPRLEKSLKLDLMVQAPQISMNLLTTLQRLAPFGAGNPPVCLGCANLKIVDEAIFGRARDHKRLVVADEAGRRQEVIWWGGASQSSPAGEFDLAFTLSPDDFKGGDAVQVELIAFREWEPTPITAPTEFIDWRTATNLQSLISNLHSPLIWAEGDINSSFVTLRGHSSLARHHLHPADSLIIFTAPPGHDIFQQALTLVSPQRIYLVGQPSSLDDFPAFINHLMGLVKYAMARKEGELVLEELAGALGHRVTTVRLGLDWLAAQGKLFIEVEEEELLVVRPARQPPTAAAEAIETILQSALAETKAYRQFFRQASLGSFKEIIP